MKEISENELKKILRLHELWLNNDPNGEKANLSDADLSYADLGGADLSYADLRGAILSDANLDFSCLNLSCKTLKAKFDQKHVIQTIYHAAKPTENNNLNIGDKDLIELLNSDLFKKVVNKFHRVEECGEFKGINNN